MYINYVMLYEENRRIKNFEINRNVYEIMYNYMEIIQGVE